MYVLQKEGVIPLFCMSNQIQRKRKNKLALVIPAHNEELVILHTIKSALAAGQKKQHIYVVDDNSTDATSEIAKTALPAKNVMKVRRSGKALAIKKAVKKFRITSRYHWIHIADADGVFDPNYFREFKTRLDSSKKYAAATGHVQSLRGGWVSKFRTYEYTIGLEIMRRIQSWLGVITVIPGPTSCFRTDVFKKLDINHTSLTEDFDLTLQIHRKKLGKIAYIPQAKSFTQDPKDFKDFKNQVSRWYRGFWQGLRHHRVGLKPQKLDAYVLFTIGETLIFSFEIILLIALSTVSSVGQGLFAIYFLFDVLLMFGWAVFSAALNNRWDILQSFPLFYILRFTNLYIFYKSFVEVILLGKYKTIKPGWETGNRRYRIQTG